MGIQLASDHTFIVKSHTKELANKPISLHDMKKLTCSDHCDLIYFLSALAVSWYEVGIIRSGLLTVTDQFTRVEMENLRR